MSFRITRDTLLKIVVYGVLISVFAVIQTTVLARFLFFGTKPDLMFAIVLSIAMFEGEKVGAIAGTAAGFLTESLGSWGIGVLPLFYMIAGFLCGICTAYIFRRTLATWSLYVLVGYVAKALLNIIYIVFYWKDYTVGDVFSTVIIPEYIGSVLLSPLCYGLCRLVARLFHKSYELKS